VVLRDPGVERAISREGVSCDFCHSIASIGGSDGSGKLRLDPRGVRYGAPRDGAGADPDPGKPAAPHPVGRTEALRDPRLCALCHSDFDRNGIPLERTYKEWLDSPYAQQGVVCVDEVAGCELPSACEDFDPCQSSVSAAPVGCYGCVDAICGTPGNELCCVDEGVASQGWDSICVTATADDSYGACTGLCP